MELAFRRVFLKKRYPLAISRGVSTGSLNLFIFLREGEHVGIGECAPGLGWDDSLSEIAEPMLQQIFGEVKGHSIHEAYELAREALLPPPAVAGLDIALWDLKAKRAGMPLNAMLGLSGCCVQGSVTVGLNSPEIVGERVHEILGRTGARALKIKLGSPEGLDHDQASYSAAMEAARPFDVRLRVDANGGWGLQDALKMLAWLARRGCEYVEQPLAEGHEEELPALFSGRPLPIFVDESCRFSTDIPSFASAVDGVNLKLMKCGGITEALRIVATARAFGLQTMIGCMGESSVAISAGASLGALFDHIDLDSHLNLDPDPAMGAWWIDGRLIPPDQPGHGGSIPEN